MLYMYTPATCKISIYKQLFFSKSVKINVYAVVIVSLKIFFRLRRFIIVF